MYNRAFEWDAAKNAANRKKHGIDFEIAARVFDDPDLVLIELSMFTVRKKKAMKKLSASSRREKLVRVKAEDIFNRPLTRSQRAALQRLKDLPESKIDYSDIPPLTEEQLASAFRPKSKQLIAVRLDRDVLAWLKEYGEGYSTRINHILRAVMAQSAASGRKLSLTRTSTAARR